MRIPRVVATEDQIAHTQGLHFAYMQADGVQHGAILEEVRRHNLQGQGGPLKGDPDQPECVPRDVGVVGIDPVGSQLDLDGCSAP